MLVAVVIIDESVGFINIELTLILEVRANCALAPETIYYTFNQNQ